MVMVQFWTPGIIFTERTECKAIGMTLAVHGVSVGTFGTTSSLRCCMGNWSFAAVFAAVFAFVYLLLLLWGCFVLLLL